MRRNGLAAVLCGTALFVLGDAFGGEAAGPPHKPNIVMILVDSLRADHLSCYGYPRPTSPFMDRLAAGGVRFDNYFATSSWTAPTVMSVFTGVSSVRHGRNNVADRTPENMPAVAETLKRAGYRTLAVTCNAVAGSEYGYERGFDVFDDYAVQRDLDEGRIAGPEGGKPPAGVSDIRAVDERLVTLALEHLQKESGDAPYFLFLHLFDPHWEYYPLPEYRAMFADPDYAGTVDGSYWSLRDAGPDGHQLKTDADLRHFVDLYDAEIRQCDDAVKRFVTTLRAEGRLKDTDLLILLADHGEEFMEHDVLSHGRNLYDPGVRVPLILTAPAWLPRGATVETLASHIDWLPTLAALAGGDTPAGLPGADLLAFRDGRWTPPEREAVTFHVMKDDPPARPMIGVRTKTAKVLRYLDTNDICAFALAADPAEDQPLAVADHPEYERLLARLDAWYEEERQATGNREQATGTAGKRE